MSDDKKSFTVKDRRHFTAEGTAREPEEAPREGAAPDASTTPVQPAADPRDEAAAPAGPDAPTGPAAGGGPSEGEYEGRGLFPRDFQSLLVMLGSQASLFLAGVSPDSDTPGPPDLEGARDVITLLESLQQKTEGHRTPEEERLLSGLLYELRMAFVALRKGPVA